VPETLLKKRKSQEAARAARREEAEKRKQVSSLLMLDIKGIYWLDDYNNHTATRPRSMLSLC
jgi:hypothetical protein